MNATATKSTITLDGTYLDIISLRQSGFCCSQIMVKLVLADLGRDNPDLVRGVAALCFGSGHLGGTCGVLTGAACALSLCLESGTGREQASPELPLLLGELADWFTAQVNSPAGGTSCAEILSASPNKQGCSLLLISTLEKLRSMPEMAAAKGRNNGKP